MPTLPLRCVQVAVGQARGCSAPCTCPLIAMTYPPRVRRADSVVCPEIRGNPRDKGPPCGATRGLAQRGEPRQWSSRTRAPREQSRKRVACRKPSTAAMIRFDQAPASIARRRLSRRLMSHETRHATRNETAQRRYARKRQQPGATLIREKSPLRASRRNAGQIETVGC